MDLFFWLVVTIAFISSIFFLGVCLALTFLKRLYIKKLQSDLENIQKKINEYEEKIAVIEKIK